MKLKDLINISRPKFWLYLAGTYFVGLVFASDNPSQLFTSFYVLNFLFFLIPANFLLYGINDYFDFDTDQYNDKKDSHEHRLKLKEKNLLIGYLLLCAALSFFVTALQTQIEVQLLFTLFLLLSYFYSAPPLRLKSFPLVDFSSNILYGIPALIAYYQVSGSFPPLLAIIAIFCWTSAMHLFSAIPDINPDKKARLHTSAVVFGKKLSLVICLIFWLLAATITMFINPSPILVLSVIYPIIPFFLLIDKHLNINKIYWYFPYLNTFAGFILFLIAVIK